VHPTGGIESHNQDLPKLSCRNDARFSGQADSGRGFTLSRSAYSID